MSTHISVTKSDRSATDAASPHSSSRMRATSLVPPASGIRAVDRGLPSVVQRKPAAARRASEAASRKPSTAGGGLPAQLLAAIRATSGLDLSDVRVHTNSTIPAQIGADAYALGQNIHLGPAQERHIPHEAWHIVQQRQGRVRRTSDVGGVAINDDPALEREADEMGRQTAAAATRTQQSERPANDGEATPLAAGTTAWTVVQRVVATNRQYIDAGKPPRFGRLFAARHLLNDQDSNADTLVDTTPIDKKGERTPPRIPNTAAAYAQAMNRFNNLTGHVTHILEPTIDPPRPGKLVSERGGSIRYHPFECERAWKFERIDNADAAPNGTRYEARLAALMGSRRTAKLSARGGSVNHWDQGLNGNWF